jgi:hypothetical protein
MTDKAICVESPLSLHYFQPLWESDKDSKTVLYCVHCGELRLIDIVQLDWSKADA